VTVLYDVIAADLPWTTPAPPDLYHRHWVEIGHLSSRLVAISEHTARQYRALIAEPNLLAVPIEACPLPLAFLARAASLSPVPVPALMGRRFVLYVSTIETRKNHLLLLHAWDRLLRELPPEQVPQLVFVGAWGWGTEATRLMVERNWRLAGHLHVLTGVPDETLLWLYRHALFAVFPALAEGFGLGAAEAVALGTPCLVSDCPALIEATQGLMPALDPLDLPGWVAELKRLFTDAAALAKLRARTAGSARCRRMPSAARWRRRRWQWRRNATPPAGRTRHEWPLPDAGALSAGGAAARRTGARGLFARCAACRRLAGKGGGHLSRRLLSAGRAWRRGHPTRR